MFVNIFFFYRNKISEINTTNEMFLSNTTKKSNLKRGPQFETLVRMGFVN